jgi:hypothetical protein
MSPPVVGAAAEAYLGCMSEPRAVEQAEDQDKPKPPVPQPTAKEIGGPKGPDPTRYGDWELNGRCIDF